MNGLPNNIVMRIIREGHLPKFNEVMGQLTELTPKFDSGIEEVIKTQTMDGLPNDIIIKIIGMSDLNWRNQHKKRFQGCLEIVENLSGLVEGSRDCSEGYRFQDTDTEFSIKDLWENFEGGSSCSWEEWEFGDGTIRSNLFLRYLTTI